MTGLDTNDTPLNARSSGQNRYAAMQGAAKPLDPVSALLETRLGKHADSPTVGSAIVKVFAENGMGVVKDAGLAAFFGPLALTVNSTVEGPAKAHMDIATRQGKARLDTSTLGTVRHMGESIVKLALSTQAQTLIAAILVSGCTGGNVSAAEAQTYLSPDVMGAITTASTGGMDGDQFVNVVQHCLLAAGAFAGAGAVLKGGLKALDKLDDMMRDNIDAIGDGLKGIFKADADTTLRQDPNQMLVGAEATRVTAKGMSAQAHMDAQAMKRRLDSGQVDLDEEQETKDAIAAANRGYLHDMMHRMKAGEKVDLSLKDAADIAAETNLIREMEPSERAAIGFGDYFDTGAAKAEPATAAAPAAGTTQTKTIKKPAVSVGMGTGVMA